MSPERSLALVAAAESAVRDERALGGERAISRTVGVTAMRADTTDSVAVSIAYALSDVMIADLAQSRQIVIVDRMRTAALADEIHLASFGDASTAPSGGKLRTASELVVGALGGRANGDVRLDASLITVVSGRTGETVAAAAPLERVIDAEKRVAFGLMGQLGVVLSASERVAIERRRTASVRALVSYGRGVWLQVQHRDAEASAAFDDAAVADPAFAPARARSREAHVKAADQTPAAAPLPAIQRAAIQAESRPTAPLSASAPTHATPSASSTSAAAPSPASASVSATPRSSASVAANPEATHKEQRPRKARAVPRVHHNEPRTAKLGRRH